MNVLTSDFGPISFEDNVMFNQIMGLLGQNIQWSSNREDFKAESEDEWITFDENKDETSSITDNFDLLDDEDDADVKLPRKSIPNFKSMSSFNKSNLV